MTGGKETQGPDASRRLQDVRQKESGELICAGALDGGRGEINPAPAGHETMVRQGSS